MIGLMNRWIHFLFALLLVRHKKFSSWAMIPAVSKSLKGTPGFRSIENQPVRIISFPHTHSYTHPTGSAAGRASWWLAFACCCARCRRRRTRFASIAKSHSPTTSGADAVAIVVIRALPHLRRARSKPSPRRPVPALPRLGVGGQGPLLLRGGQAGPEPAARGRGLLGGRPRALLAARQEGPGLHARGGGPGLHAPRRAAAPVFGSGGGRGGRTRGGLFARLAEPGGLCGVWPAAAAAAAARRGEGPAVWRPTLGVWEAGHGAVGRGVVANGGTRRLGR